MTRSFCGISNNEFKFRNAKNQIVDKNVFFGQLVTNLKSERVQLYLKF